MKRSGVVACLGRTNVGKSTLVNRLLGQKLVIVSPKPQTTSRRLRGIVNVPGGQFVIVDTPGLHAERAFTLRPTPDGSSTVVVSYETQVGPLAWLGRVYLAPRLHAANQEMFEDLARAAGQRAATHATLAAA